MLDRLKCKLSEIYKQNVSVSKQLIAIRNIMHDALLYGLLCKKKLNLYHSPLEYVNNCLSHFEKVYQFVMT